MESARGTKWVWTMEKYKVLVAALLSLSMGALASCSPAGTPSSSNSTPSSEATTLTGTDPEANATVAAPVPMIHVMFSAKIDPQASGVEITTADGKPVEVGGVMPMGDSMLMATPKTPLPAGQYTVKWHAMGADSKPLQGEFAFTVQ